MKAKINGLEVDGTPAEIAVLAKLLKKVDKKVEDFSSEPVKPLVKFASKKIISCVICGKHFQKRNTLKKFCSVKCRSAYWYQKNKSKKSSWVVHDKSKVEPIIKVRKTRSDKGQRHRGYHSKAQSGRMSFVNSRANILMKRDIGMSREKAFQIANWEWDGGKSSKIKSFSDVEKAEEVVFPQLYNVSKFGSIVLRDHISKGLLPDGFVDLSVSFLTTSINPVQFWDEEKVALFYEDLVKKQSLLEKYFKSNFVIKLEPAVGKCVLKVMNIP